MAFENIRLYHFRNLLNVTIGTGARDVFLVGENGQGKTNFLEAVYFACYGSSFRTRRDITLIRHGEQEMAVDAIFQRAVEPQRIVVKQIGRKKSIEINGESISDRKELVSTVPCIVFCHDDIGFVTGVPEMQRWFMNQTISLVKPPYLASLRLYNRILRSRNAALRAGQYDLLDTLDTQLAGAGIPVRSERSRMNERFSALLTGLFSQVFEGPHGITLEYRPSWRSEDPVAELREHRDNDLRMSTTTSGPHRDRFVFRLGEKLLSDTASTGQLRLVSLILRVAQANFVHEAGGAPPVLLLDDVLLELDPRRRARFVDALPEYEQAFFTFLPDEQYSRFGGDSSLTYRVENGRLEVQPAGAGGS